MIAGHYDRSTLQALGSLLFVSCQAGKLWSRALPIKNCMLWKVEAGSCLLVDLVAAPDGGVVVRREQPLVGPGVRGRVQAELRLIDGQRHVGTRPQCRHTRPCGNGAPLRSDRSPERLVITRHRVCELAGGHS